MRLRAPLSLALAGALVLVSGACSSLTDSDAVTVNGVGISRQSLERELEAASENSGYQEVLERQVQTDAPGEGEGTFDSGFVAGLLSLRVYFQLIEAGLDERGVAVSDDDLLAAREQLEGGLPDPALLDDIGTGVRDDLIRRFALINVLGRELGGVTEEAERAIYDQDPTAYDEACVSHILVGLEGRTAEAAKARADDLAAQLAAGADFTELATTQSDDTTAAAAGGDLQCGGRGRFVPAFDDVVFELPVDQVSPPVETQFGYHLIKVTQRRPLTFEQAKPTIESQLNAQSGEAVTDFVVEESCGADVEVNVRYGQWDVEGCGDAAAGPARVVPSEGPTTTTGPAPAEPADEAPPGQ